VLFATFFICLFILLMQFLWKYVDEMIGKGLSLTVLAEFFFYSALTLVPMALPLAVLLAALMTFGNFGERLELLAMKAAGISLFRIIRPLVIAISFISIGAFFFANNVIPHSQVKLWTLIYSIRDKSSEIEIPENVFYHGISGYSVYVKGKDHKHNLLKDIMIYDLSKGFENITVTVADSARLQFTDDKQFIVFTLYNGESFENLKDQKTARSNVPYRRESFQMKQTLIEFDGSFTKMDESMMTNKYVSKNVLQLGRDIDTFNVKIDSLARDFKQQATRSMPYYQNNTDNTRLTNKPVVDVSTQLSIDSLYNTLSNDDKREAIRRALQETSATSSSLSFKKYEIEDNQYLLRRHAIEWHRKFTLSFACLIFFFIGAPLGAIIRKGGLGMPVVISVFLFIIYYIIDNTGYKFAREGMWQVWEGMWLSAAVLLPFGIFLTYKAAKDAALLNADAYVLVIKKISILINPSSLYIKVYKKTMRKLTDKLNI
jgi:lipopolysaccharide export system permease protein